jgi:aminoglycoside/choline kinase family phosphotransferase
MSQELMEIVLENKWASKRENILLLAGDASSRQYYRILQDNKTYVLCFDQSIVEKKENHNFLRMQQLLVENNISVPAIYEIDYNNGLILQEDLGDLTMLGLNSISSKNQVLTTYQQAIDIQLTINLIRGQNVKSVPFNSKFDVEKLMQEMDLTITHFVSLYLEIKEDDFITELRGDLLKVTSEIASLETVTTHRDYHSRNIMIKDERLVVIDFQDARQGIPQYDLVSLVDDCYFSLTTTEKEFLKKYYLNNAKLKNITKEGLNDFLYQYDLMKIQRTLKAIGSFCFINNTKGNSRYLKYVGYAFNNIRELLLEKPSLPALKKLVKIYYAK